MKSSSSPPRNDYHPTPIIDGLIFPEGPRWHNDRFYFSDMNDAKVIVSDIDGNSKVLIQMPGPCSGLGWRPDGTLLIVSMLDRSLFAWDGQNLEMICDMSHLATYHCNDMVVDKKGRAYVGNFGFDLSSRDRKTPAEIILVDENNKASVVADKVLFPNGPVITDDGKTLIVGETFGNCLTSFAIREDGTLEEGRTWADLPGINPDGICLDAQNGIWVSCPGTAKVYRVEEGGNITDIINVETNAYACMLGGPDRKTLFLCTADNLYRGGRIETVRVDIPGAGLP